MCDRFKIVYVYIFKCVCIIIKIVIKFLLFEFKKDNYRINKKISIFKY